MTLLERILSWFKRDPTIQNARYSDGFRALDPDRVFVEFKLSERAKSRAERLRDAPALDIADGTEETISAHFKAYEIDQLRVAHDRILFQKQIIDRTALLFNLQALRGRVDARLAEATARARVCEAYFQAAMLPLRDARNQLDDFRRKNGLTRTLPRNQGWDPIVKWTLVIGAMVVEAAANVGFYATAFTTGLITAYAIAVAISLINVMIPLQFAKNLIVQVNSNSKLWKVVGWLSVFLTVVFVMGFNLLTTHIREAGIQGQDNGAAEITFATQLALSTFITNPFGLTDALSVLMLIMGVFLGFMAAVGGYNFDDPVPGFGDVWRQYRAEQEKLLTLIEDTHQELGDCFDEISKEIDSRIAALADSQTKIVRAQEKIANISAGCRQFQNQLTVSFDAVVQLYRAELEKNGILTGEIAAPVYDAEQFIAREREEVDSDAVAANALLREAARVLPQLQALVRRRNEELTAGVRQLEEIEELRSAA